jgi:hypothetical protein
VPVRSLSGLPPATNPELGAAYLVFRVTDAQKDMGRRVGALSMVVTVAVRACAKDALTAGGH